jgi:hypothetical protein
MRVYFCISLVQSRAAKDWFLAHQYADADITVEKIDDFGYDGKVFNVPSGNDDAGANGYVVIGRK